jgi:SSS family transporter
VRTIDWIVLAAWLIGLAAFGMWRGRGSNTTEKFLLAGRTMPWYAMGLSIMATQASAITFISTTGQSYVDGMRFVQFYFGLPLAMVLIAAFVVPRFRSSGVYTAYEYLERRFDGRVRALVSAVFLVQRGLGVGVSLSAPAIVLTVLTGVPETATIVVMGMLVVLYTVTGGIAAVTWSDMAQMVVMTMGLLAALITALILLPPGVGFTDALHVAGAAGRLNPVTFTFNFNDRYNLWSGLCGGLFLMLAYFGCDQSQVQRYLTGRSLTESRLSLLFNGLAKIPMQFFILFIGAMVFVFFTFEKPPVLFNPVQNRRISVESGARFDQAFAARRDAARQVVRQPDDAAALDRFRQAQRSLDASRADALQSAGGGADTNYIFLTFVTHYMPVGIVGLIMAVIFGAAMSVASGEINSLATVTVVDVYRRFVNSESSDRQSLLASRIATGFWGVYAMITAHFARNLGSLIETVNLLGSLFYGSLLGIFGLAFFFPRVTAPAAFYGVLIGQAVVFAAKYYTSLAFLWFPLLGAATVIVSAIALNLLLPSRPAEGIVTGRNR